MEQHFVAGELCQGSSIGKGLFSSFIGSTTVTVSSPSTSLSNQGTLLFSDGKLKIGPNLVVSYAMYLLLVNQLKIIFWQPHCTFQVQCEIVKLLILYCALFLIVWSNHRVQQSWTNIKSPVVKNWYLNLLKCLNIIKHDWSYE